MKPIIYFSIVTLLVNLPRSEANLRNLIQNNVAGPPLNFKTVSWAFDPDAGMRRRAEYEAMYGRYGHRHVEKIGLGEDGREEERRRQQQHRDSIGALSYQVPS